LPIEMHDLHAKRIFSLKNSTLCSAVTLFIKHASKIAQRLPKYFYFVPTTIEFPPANGSMFVSRNPASRIQPTQSAPV